MPPPQGPTIFGPSEYSSISGKRFNDAFKLRSSYYRGVILFGHLGIGSKLASPWKKGLPFGVLLVGTMLPDLVDKPLYYSGLAPGLITGTRTFGHTALFCATLWAVGLAARSRVFAALALGVASHLLLDNFVDRFMPNPGSEGLLALLWPFLGTRFPVLPYRTIGEQVATVFQPVMIGAEVVGLALLQWHFWKSVHRTEIVESATEIIQAKRTKKLKRY